MSPILRRFALLSAAIFALSPVVLLAQATKVDSPEKAELQAVETKWADAVNLRDQYGLENVLSPMFVDISANGDISTRDQMIAQMVSKGLNIQKFEQKVITVRVIGQVAVVNGTYSFQKTIGGAPVEEKGVFTHVYERLRLGWACVNSQRTLIREDSLNKPKAAKKPSNAELPMHLPLIYKGGDAKPAATTTPPTN
jgi:ketosteroid isomerase-like protein